MVSAPSEPWLKDLGTASAKWRALFLVLTLFDLAIIGGGFYSGAFWEMEIVATVVAFSPADVTRLNGNAYMTLALSGALYLVVNSRVPNTGGGTKSKYMDFSPVAVLRSVYTVGVAACLIAFSCNILALLFFEHAFYMLSPDRYSLYLSLGALMFVVGSW